MQKTWEILRQIFLYKFATGINVELVEHDALGTL